MGKSARRTDVDYSDQFKPAMILGAPTSELWANNFFATSFQESYDPQTGAHSLRLGRTTTDTDTKSETTQMTTPVTGLQPFLREVVVIRKTDYQAICVEGGLNQLGVFVLMTKTVDAGGGLTEVHLNSRYMPFAQLTDLIVDVNGDGVLEIALPDKDIVKLNVTLRATISDEPEYRTFKTEVIVENLPDASRKDMENALNAQAAGIVAFLGAQNAEAWPPTSGVTAAEFAISRANKRRLAAALIVVGSVIGIVNEFYDHPILGSFGIGLTATTALVTMWFDSPEPQQEPQQQLPQAQV